jgi:hypothetical protein
MYTASKYKIQKRKDKKIKEGKGKISKKHKSKI